MRFVYYNSWRQKKKGHPTRLQSEIIANGERIMNVLLRNKAAKSRRCFSNALVGIELGDYYVDLRPQAKASLGGRRWR